MTMKIAVAVANCGECPNHKYGSGGRFDCAIMDWAPLPADKRIPAWCPLPDHPGPIMARAVQSLTDAKTVLERAKTEAQQADAARLRELLQIAAEQVARI